MAEWRGNSRRAHGLGGAWEVRGPLLILPWSDPGLQGSHTPWARAERFVTKSVSCPGRPLDLPLSYFQARSAWLHKADISWPEGHRNNQRSQAPQWQSTGWEGKGDRFSFCTTSTDCPLLIGTRKLGWEHLAPRGSMASSGHPRLPPPDPHGLCPLLNTLAYFCPRAFAPAPCSVQDTGPPGLHSAGAAMSCRSQPEMSSLHEATKPTPSSSSVSSSSPAETSIRP